MGTYVAGFGFGKLFSDDSLNNVWSLLMTESRVFLSLLVEPQLLLSLKLAIVGTVLVAINYGDLILRGDTGK